MQLLEALVFGLPMICGNCGREVPKTDKMGLCGKCRYQYKRQHSHRKPKAVVE